MSWYLMDQSKSDRVLKKLVTHALYYVNIWMNVDEPMTAGVDYLLNNSMKEAHISQVMTTDCSLFHFCGDYQHPLDVA